MNVVHHFDPSKTITIEQVKGGLNTTDEQIMANVAENIRRGLPQVQPYEPNDNTVLIVCGGSSLKTTEDELREAYWAGGKIVTINGAYDWCLDRNYKPSAAIILDARESNARFVERPVTGCRYLLASQCHFRTFDNCRDREVYIWHACSAGEPELAILNDYYFSRCHPITLGTTAGIRAISLLRTLGYTKMEIFGLDSCWLGDEHHAYPQQENMKDRRMSVWLRPRDRDEEAIRFECAPWHMRQAEDFKELIKERGNLFQLNVHGPGLIASILRTGASIQMEN